MIEETKYYIVTLSFVYADELMNDTMLIDVHPIIYLANQIGLNTNWSQISLIYSEEITYDQYIKYNALINNQ